MLVQVIAWTAVAMTCLVEGAPRKAGVAGDASHQLAVEHRQVHPTVHPVHDVVDAVLKSKTMSAVDEAASRVTTAFGDIIDDLGDFVVATVKELPGTIREVSDRVGQAVADGSEQVVIVVRGLKNATTKAPPHTLTQTVDKVFQAANSSQTATSMHDLQKRISQSVARIFGSFMLSLGDIDKAVADGIRQVSGGSQQAKPTALGSNPPYKDNEIQDIA